MTVREKLREYLEDCSDQELLSVIRDVNSHNGACEDLLWYDMYLFDEFMDGKKPREIAELICSGEFDIDEKYFRYDSCGDLESCDIIELDDYEISDIIDELLDMPLSQLSGEVKFLLMEGDDDEDSVYDDDDEEDDYE